MKKETSQTRKTSSSPPIGKKLRLVFLGSPACALPTLEALLSSPHSVELVITQPDKPSGRGRRLQPPPVKKFALEKGLRIYQTRRIRKDETALSLLQELRPDAGVVVAFGQIIPPAILDIPPYGFLNLHFSLLPRYRGASPVAHALLNGEKKTGITIFRLNEKMDEGDIFTWREVEILPEETAGELENRLAEIGAQLLLETLAKIDKITPQPQDHSQATYAPLLKKEDGLINWELTAVEIANRIRAFTPWPSAYTFFKGERVKLLKARALSPENIYSAQPEAIGQAMSQPVLPGEIIAVDKSGIYVSCGQKTILQLLELQPANKKAMPAFQFSLGRRIKPGERFSLSSSHL
ncbi:methionyl-tRNA formyltransferase [Candidatus Aminicenantes bacterium AC-334-K16]|mgnify:CR=1 FL=1|jgi:methionyl-tRNA formyltransferase|nr:methionyl-tRNA formyltransferase [Candidatus Aminicenantes bacterium AC-334-K16]